MGQQANLYGPPGSGKTRKLTGIADSVVREQGPAALGAVTFTRTAAAELKTRLAPLVGAEHHPNLSLVFPHVGTIHALCYALIGRPKVITNAQKREWAHSLGDHDARFNGPERVDWLDTYDVGGERSDRSDTSAALHILSIARQQMLPVEAAYHLFAKRGAELPPSLEKVQRLITSYQGYKHEEQVIDFEDMLEEGARERLNVGFLLADEAQDNSALLWHVLRAWGANIPYTVAAGDPWQAIFQFNGGNPALFRNQPGGWTTIDDSHRLTGLSADFALDILKRGGYAEDPLLGTWGGVHDGSARDGSKFYLARTGVLVEELAADLLNEGTPFTYLSGRQGPLGPGPTAAWRAAHELLVEGSAPVQSVLTFVRSLKKGTLEQRDQRWLEVVAAEQPDRRVALEELPWAPSVELLQQRLPNHTYYSRVVQGYGYSALVLPPAVRVGTIHAAKGREADEVYLDRNWGFLPGTAALEGDLGEVCVAYVACSRHRVALHILDKGGRRGIDYRFPTRRVYAEA